MPDYLMTLLVVVVFLSAVVFLPMVIENGLFGVLLALLFGRKKHSDNSDKDRNTTRKMG